MFHFQNPVNDWPRAVAILPAGYWIKAVDNVQLLNEAKGVNPGIKTVLRHHYDAGQQFDGGIEGNKARARQFFSTFIDGTFDQYAHNVDAIEGFNEYYGNSQSATEKATILNWVKAVNEVWTKEYRSQTEYSHIRLCSCNTAIGNDIPLEAARIVYENDGLLGYHPYVAVDSQQVQAKKMVAMSELTIAPRTDMRAETSPFYTEPESAIEAVMSPGEIHFNDWQWYSGRWVQMDTLYRANGIFVNWLFTEGGPIERRADGGLDPQNGWKHPNVYGGNVDLYVKNIEYFLNNTANWNKQNNNRASNVTLFTSGGWNIWQYFETQQPEMDAIANMAKNFVPKEPGMSWQDELWNESIKRQAISLNPNASLQAAIFNDGFVPVQSEFWYTTSDQIQRACMAAEHLETGERRVYYAVVPEWNNVQWFTDPKLPSLATL